STPNPPAPHSTLSRASPPDSAPLRPGLPVHPPSPPATRRSKVPARWSARWAFPPSQVPLRVTPSPSVLPVDSAAVPAAAASALFPAPGPALRAMHPPPLVTESPDAPAQDSRSAPQAASSPDTRRK